MIKGRHPAWAPALSCQAPLSGTVWTKSQGHLVAWHWLCWTLTEAQETKGAGAVPSVHWPSLGHARGVTSQGGDGASMCWEPWMPRVLILSPHTSKPPEGTFPGMYLMPAARHRQPIGTLERKKVAVSELDMKSAPNTLTSPLRTPHV